MYCKNCGNKINQEEMFCTNCGTKVERENNLNNNSNQNFNMNNMNQQPMESNFSNQNFNMNNMNQQPMESNFSNQNMQMNNSVNQTNPLAKPKKKSPLKIIGIIVGVIVLLIVLVIGLILITTSNSEKLVCSSPEGSITVLYNEKGIVGYTAIGISYDFEGQKRIAENIGIDEYITQFNNWFVTSTTGYCTINGEKVTTENQIENNTSNQETLEKGKRVGSDEFGYITIPEDWANFVDIDGNSTLQYSYANIYIATLFALPTTEIDAYTYASNIMNKLQTDGVSNVEGAVVTVGKYSAYQVYGYYEDSNIWLVCWFFEAEDGQTHYISIEGPDKTSEHFHIPNSFSLEK